MNADPFDFNGDGHLDDFEEAGKAQWIDESIRQTDEEFQESRNTSGVTGTGTHSSPNYVYHTTNPVLAPFANVLLILARAGTACAWNPQCDASYRRQVQRR
jgi:hypothetical protein